MKRLILLSGPSCVGKTPLYKAFRRTFRGLSAGIFPVIGYTDRSARPGEIDGKVHYFRTNRYIRSLSDKDGYTVIKVRADLQALDMHKLSQDIRKKNMLFEGNPFAAVAIMRHELLKKYPKTGIFLSPVSREEILFMKKHRMDIRSCVTKIMLEKLKRRMLKQKGVIPSEDLRDLSRRAKSAYTELKYAWRFDYVIPNHDGEDSDNWKRAGFPEGEAGEVLKAFAQIVKGRVPALAEKWDKDLIA